MDQDSVVDERKTAESGSTTCAHRRLINDVLDKNGERTGKVQCLECKAIFDDPAWS